MTVSPPTAKGIYALHDKLQPLYDLSVFVVGGVYFELLRQVHNHIGDRYLEPGGCTASVAITIATR